MKTHAVTFVRAALVTACAAGLSLSLFAGKDYYVDANFGHDDWDGSTAAIPTEEQKQLPVVPGPRKTLAAAMAISGLASGDTVHAAPGVYNEGEMWTSSAGSNRVIVATGVLLVADQGASVTTIEGKISTADGNTNGCADDSMRAVYLGAGAAIKDFTVTKGRSTGNGGGVCGAGLVVGCIITNNVVAGSGRGNAAASSAVLLRCIIGEDPAGTWSCYASVCLIDCVYDSPKTGYSGCKAYNTTFVRGSVYSGAPAYNCIFLSGNHAQTDLYNCLTTSQEGTGVDKDGKNTFGIDKAQLAYDPVTYRPLPGSLAIDTGTDEYYALATNGWTGTKAWWRTFVTGTDYAGGPRRLGAAIDIGAGEADPGTRMLTITDAQTALVVTGAAKGTTILHQGETKTFTLARDYSTEKLCTGVTVNGEFLSFSGENADKVYEYTYGYGDPVEALVIEAVYAEHNDWYVNCNTDPAKGLVGDDANSGYTKYRAKRTLAGAMENALLKSGDTVHAAPGVYNEGGMSNVAGSNRVVVADGVLLVADQGASVTVIEGKVSEAEGNEDGCAADSMRAVYLNNSSVLRGFTVTKGRPNYPYPDGKDGNSMGAGVYGGLAVECMFSNNVTKARGNAAYGSDLLRCRIGVDPAGSYSAYAGVCLIDCVYDSPKPAYSSCTAYNTTFVRGYVNHTSSKAYNCIFLSGHNNATHYNCISTAEQGVGTDGDDKCSFKVDKTKLAYDSVSFRPLAGSEAIDVGNGSYYALATNDWTKTKAWWQSFVTGTDYAGGPRRLGAAIDVGAGEYNPATRTLTISDAQTALVVTGAEKGLTIMRDGQTNTVTLARDYSTMKLCTGVTVNGEFFSFTGENADKPYSFVFAYDDPVTNLVIEAVYAEHNDWYVNCNTDPEKGLVGDDANNGYTKYQAKRTLVGAMTNALLAEGDTVHAAAGVYNEGTMADSPTSTVTNRVIVKKNVGLVADEGAAVTAIEGFIPEEAKWNTTDPIRGVSLSSGAYLRGFTVRNSMASMGQGTGLIYGNSGGGVSGGAAIIDCVITNCYAVRGGGVASGDAVLIRCRVADNKNFPTETTNPAGGKVTCTATAIYYCKGVYDTEVSGSAMSLGTAVNSRFTNLNRNDSAMTPVYNCYVENDGGHLSLTNSVVGHAVSANSHLGAGSRDGTLLKFDADGRPDRSDPTTAEYAIDKGGNAYYAYPDVWASEAGWDVAGGQRIYNRTVDIGAGEYDWRGDFARAIKRTRKLAVDEATPNVTMNEFGQVTLSNGDSLKFALELPVEGPVTFALDRTDGVTVTVDGGEAIEPTDGKFTFLASSGSHVVTIAYAGEGQAAIVSCSLPAKGVVLIVR